MSPIQKSEDELNSSKALNKTDLMMTVNGSTYISSSPIEVSAAVLAVKLFVSKPFEWVLLQNNIISFFLTECDLHIFDPYRAGSCCTLSEACGVRYLEAVPNVAVK